MMKSQPLNLDYRSSDDQGEKAAASCFSTPPHILLRPGRNPEDATFKSSINNPRMCFFYNYGPESWFPLTDNSLPEPRP